MRHWETGFEILQVLAVLFNLKDVKRRVGDSIRCTTGIAECSENNEGDMNDVGGIEKHGESLAQGNDRQAETGIEVTTKLDFYSSI